MKRACVIALLPLILASARADDKPDLQTILDAWKAREKSIQSFDVRWWSKRSENAKADANNKAAETDDPFINRYRFLVDARGRMKLTEVGRQWVRSKSDFAPWDTVDLFDGDHRKILATGGAADYPRVILDPMPPPDGADTKIFLRDPRALQLNMVFRPLNGTFHVFDSAQLKLKNEMEMIGSTRTLVLDHGQGSVWVDPSKDYLPIRYTEDHQGTTIRQIEISYVYSDVYGWVPDSWTSSRMDAARQRPMTDFAKVIEYSINKPIADSEFELDLSAGAYVTDYPAKESYILRPDGTRRRLKPGELNGHNYEELLKSEPDSK